MNQSDDFENERHSRFLVRFFFVLAMLLLAVFLFLSQVFAWGRVSDSNEEVNELRRELNDIRSQAETRGTKADCLALYRNDVTAAIGLAVAANNRLFIALSARPPAQTDEERAANAAANIELSKLLEEATGPLVDASNALSEYDIIDPPPDKCPHPNATMVTGDD